MHLTSLLAEPADLRDLLTQIQQPALYTHLGVMSVPGLREPVPAAYTGEGCMEGACQARPAASMREQRSRRGFTAFLTVVTCLPEPFGQTPLRLIAEAQGAADLGDVLRVSNRQVGAETQIHKTLALGRNDLVELAGRAGRAHADVVLSHVQQASEVHLRGGQSIRERYLWTARVIVGPMGGPVDLDSVVALMRARDPRAWAGRRCPLDPIRRDFAVREGRALPFPRATYEPIGSVYVHPWPLGPGLAPALAQTAEASVRRLLGSLCV